MLRDDEKSLIRKSVGALRNGLEGFTPRRAQLEMIASVAHAIGACHEPEDTNRQGRNIAVVEAGTGTGKAIGYLLPAIVLARSPVVEIPRRNRAAGASRASTSSRPRSPNCR